MSATDDREAVRQRLWEAVEEMRIGMLGARPPHHMQPMTGFADAGGNAIYFFSRNDTDLVRELGAAATAHFVVISRDHSLRACLQGSLEIAHDRHKIDQYWSPVVAAWFPHGKEDPHLTLLRFDMHSADVWISEAGPIKFAYEITKSNLTKSEPNLGVHARFEA